MAGDLVETARKYDVQPDAVLPGLDDLPGVAAVAAADVCDTEATYFDTVDLDLTRAGISVQRWAGGDGAGWHLKLAAVGSWTEMRAPVGPSSTTIPKRLRTTVLARTRGRTLSAVATVRTHRISHRLLDSQGRVLAEVSDRRVTASATRAAAAKSWREWEVALFDGDRQVLEETAQRLRGKGAEPARWPSTLAHTLHGQLDAVSTAALPRPERKGAERNGPAMVVVQARLIAQIDRLCTLDPLVRVDAPDALHDIRVAIRRLRAALATYRPLLDRQVTEPLRSELKWLAGELSPARDAEVMHARLRTMLAAESPVVLRGGATSYIERELRREHRRARSRALRTLESARYLTLLERLDVLAETPPWTGRAEAAVDDVLLARVRHDWERLEGRVATARRADDVSERAHLLHEARKAAKRARYAVEPLVPVFGKRARRLLRAAKRLQSVLGEHHDSVISREWLRQLADSASAQGTSTFTLGLLYAREEAMADANEADFTAAWRKASRRKTLRLIR